jgi:hypothetical protein
MRGKIRNRKAAQQIRDFSGLRYGKITPTDIDAFIDFGNKTFIIVEGKHGNAELPYGQRLALERLCDAITNGIDAWLLVTRYDTPSDEDVNYASSKVTSYRHEKVWKNTKKDVTLKQFVDWIHEKTYGGNK